MSVSPKLSRRSWLLATATGFGSLPGWFDALALAGNQAKRRRAVILLWMNGGPSTIDLWDLKPGHANGGPFREIQTSVPGLRIGEVLPGLARWGDRLALVRSMSTKEGDHGRAAFLARTGNLPTGPIQFPGIGAVLAKELEDESATLPAHVRLISPVRNTDVLQGTGSGFLGPRYAPLVIGEHGMLETTVDQALRVPHLARTEGIGEKQFDDRVHLLRGLNEGFSTGRSGEMLDAFRTAGEQAVRLMHPVAARAFRLEEERDTVRDRYGRNLFGQGCLLARRLVERGVPFVEVTLDGWDTHNDNFTTMKRLGPTLDSGWSALMQDLQDRGLLDSTLIVWLGEFGRTPRINGTSGRDHYPNAWATVLAGGGIRGGQAIGRTSADGTAVDDRPITIPDFLATVCRAVGLDPRKQNLSNVGRPIRLVPPTARAIDEVLA